MSYNLINKVKKYIFEGYNDISIVEKINHSLDQIELMSIYMNKRYVDDFNNISNNGTHSYYPEYIGNEYKYIIDGYFKNIT